MKISLNWLKDFIEVPVELRELKTTLVMLGLGVESLSRHDDDWILDVEIATNRPDCLSHYGVARELATAYRKPLKKLEVILKETIPAASSEISVEILNPELASRYCARIIRNIQVKPSPDWLIERLEAGGMRPINQVADVTNYVLLELGQPLHAFDLARIRQRKVLVRRAGADESIKTLDGMDRKLSPENLVIADAERPVALAGVMGGEDSAVGGATKSVLIESAWFDPVSIRRTAKAQGLHTEASHRFERGADIEMAPLALNRAAGLLAELAGGEILRGVVDVYPQRHKREKIHLRRSEILRILGAEIPWEDVERTLRSLGFELERRGTEGWSATPPSFRLDVAREADLIEEVARHYGYDRLPARLLSAPTRAGRDLPRNKELALASALVSLGYREIITSSLLHPAENSYFTHELSVMLANPLSREASALRSTLVPSMLAAMRWNLDREQHDLRFFEMGKVYAVSSNGKPEERRVLALGLTGHRQPATVHERARPLDFFDLKGDLETLWEPFDFEAARFVPKAAPHYAGGAGGRYFSGGRQLAVFGQIASNVAEEYQLRQPVWLAEIDLERLLQSPWKSHSFRSYSKFPPVERDFSLVVPSEVTYSRMVEAIDGLGLREILSFRPVDLFRSDSMALSQYSLLLRVTFQSPTHTLSGDEIAAASQKILGALARLSIRLRAPLSLLQPGERE